MSKRIQLPSGAIIELPDDVSDDEIDAIAAEADKAPRKGLAVNVTDDGDYAAPVADERPKSFMTGVGQGVTKTFDNAAAYLDNGLGAVGIDLDAIGAGIGLQSREGATDDNAKFFAGLETQGDGYGNFVGEVAGTALLTRGMGGPLTQGAAGGALVSDATTAGGVAADMGLGAVGGKIGDSVMRGAALIVAPRVNDAVRRLIDAGVPLTPGQIVGQGGVVGRSVKRVEDTLANLPLIGTAIRGQQARGMQEVNRVATNRALGPIGERLPDNVETGHEAVAFAGDRLSAAYNDVLPRLNGTIDRVFGRRIATIQQRADLPVEYQGQVQQVMREAMNTFTAGTRNPQGAAAGRYTGRTLKESSERLGDLAAGWRSADDPYLRRVGQMAEQVRAQVHALARRQNPGQAQRLRSIDEGYANLVRVERAAAGADDGIFAAKGLKTAVRQSDRSVRKRQTARGEALMQELGDDAAVVLPRTVGEGGSNAVNSAALTGGGLGVLATAAYGGSPLAAGGLAAALASPLIYTNAGQRVGQFALGRQSGPATQYLADLIRRGAVPATAAGSVAAPMLTQP